MVVGGHFWNQVEEKWLVCDTCAKASFGSDQWNN